MSSLTELDHEEPLSLSKNEYRRKKDQSAIFGITVTYTFLVFPLAVFSSVSSDMKDRLGLNNGDLSNLLMFQAISYGVGKTPNGMIVDCVDARYALWFYMTLSMISCFGWSFASTSTFMYPWIFVNMYSQSAMWPCMAKLIYNWFDAESWSKAFAYLGIASMLGTFLTFLLLGAVVSVSNWRWTLRAASIFIGMGIIFSIFMMRNRAAPPIGKDLQLMTGKAEDVGCFSLCVTIYKSASFWFVLIATGNMWAIFGLANIVPVWLTDVFRPCTETVGDNCNSLFNSGHASIVASLTFFGIICSLLYGRLFLDDVRPAKEAKVTVMFLVSATLLLVALSAWTTAVESGKRPKDNPGTWVGALTILIFLYGFFMGYPFYITPNMYALKEGGANAATLTAILDVAGLILVSGITYFGPLLSEGEGVSETALSTWRYTFYVLTAFAIIATVSMVGFQYVNLKEIRKARVRQTFDDLALSEKV